MPRVKIKTNNSKDQRKKNEILDILSKHEVFLTKLLPIADGYIVVTGNDHDMDVVFSSPTIKDLNSHNFYPQLPPELKANRSVILPNVDIHIYSNAEEEIVEELSDKNPWMAGEIDLLFKFPNSKTIKITFSQTSLAKKAQNTGLRMFQMSIPSHSIKQEKFYNIQTCFRCYAIEDHFSNQCNQSPDFKICSECAETGHTWKECKSQTKTCVICKGDHRTLAAKCPLRKEIIKEKRMADEKPNNTYSNVTKQSLSAPATQTHTHINNDMHAKIYTCILHAHLNNIAIPGTYAKELNNMLTLNNLPNIKAPDNPPSNKIINNINKTDSSNTEERTNVETQDDIDTGMEESATQENTSEQAEETPSKQTTSQPNIGNLKAKDIGLTIHTTTSTGWPKSTLTKTRLIKGIEERKYKITFTSHNTDYTSIMEAIKNEEIELDECWSTLDDCQFRKLRAGRIMERTPPSRIEKQRRN